MTVLPWKVKTHILSVNKPKARALKMAETIFELETIIEHPVKSIAADDRSSMLELAKDDSKEVCRWTQRLQHIGGS
jgi:hypothetical protein